MKGNVSKTKGNKSDIVVDAVPEKNSTNLITSGGVYNYNKANYYILGGKGWYRIAETTDAKYGECAIINISKKWSTSGTDSVIFSVLTRYKTAPCITQLNRAFGSKDIIKCRVVYDVTGDGATAYIDIWYNRDGENGFKFDIMSNGWSLNQTAQKVDEEVPEEYEYDEFEFSDRGIKAEQIVADDFIGNATTADKLKKAVKIGQTTFDGTKDISIGDIKGQVIVSNSGTEYKNQYTKIATIDISNEAWEYCAGIISVYDMSRYNFSGLLHFTAQVGETADITHTLTLKWLALNDINYADSISAVKAADGIYDLYFKPVKNYVFITVSLDDCDYPEKITLHNRQSYIKAITSVAVSSYNVDTFPEQYSSSLVVSGGVYDKLDGKLDNIPASGDEYNTGRVWLDGSPIYRRDLEVATTKKANDIYIVIEAIPLNARLVGYSFSSNDGFATISSPYFDGLWYADVSTISGSPTVAVTATITGYVEYVYNE